MPRLYVFAETGIHHISVQIITLYALAGKYFTAKQRRYDTNTGTFIVFHFTKGERKLLGCSYAGEPGEETAEATNRTDSWREIRNRDAERGTGDRY